MPSRGILEQRERTDGAQSAIMGFWSGRPCYNLSVPIQPSLPVTDERGAYWSRGKSKSRGRTAQKGNFSRIEGGLLIH